MNLNRHKFTNRANIIEAIRHYTSQLEHSPGKLAIYLKRSFLYYILGEYKKALDDAKNIIDARPYDPVALCLSGLVCEKMKDSKMAKEYIDRSGLKDSSIMYCYFGRGAFEFSQGRNEQAIKEINRVFEFSPANPRIFLYRGLAKLAKNEFDSAITDFKEARKLVPHWDPILRKLAGKAYFKGGLINSEKGNYQAALVYFSRLVKVDPTNPEGYFHMGETYMNLEDWSNAQLNFEKSAKLGRGRKIGHDSIDMLEIIAEIENQEDQDEEEFEEDEDPDNEIMEDEESVDEDSEDSEEENNNENDD